MKSKVNYNFPDEQNTDVSVEYLKTGNFIQNPEIILGMSDSDDGCDDLPDEILYKPPAKEKSARKKWRKSE